MGLGTASLVAAETAGTAFEAVTPAVAAADAAATAGGLSTLATVPTLSGLAGAATVGSSLIQGLGSIQSSRAAAASAGYNAKVAQNNAQIATQNAAFAGAQGEQDVAAAGAQTKARVGATLANQGASGVDVDSGSNVDVRESEAKIGMLQELNARSNAVKTAYGQQIQSASYTGQAALDRSAQTSDTTGGIITAGADVLGGFSNASRYTTWLNGGSPTGVFD